MGDDSTLSQALVKDMQAAFAGKLLHFCDPFELPDQNKGTEHMENACADVCDFPIVCFADGSGQFSCYDPGCPGHHRYTSSGLAQHFLTKKHYPAESEKDVMFCFVQVKSSDIRIMACDKYARVGERALRSLKNLESTFSYGSDQGVLLPNKQPPPARAAKRAHRESAR